MKKKRQPSLFCSLKNEVRELRRAFVLLISAILLIIGIFTRWVSGSPIILIHTLNISAIVPPTWLMFAFFSLSYLVGGVALGCALGSRSVSRPDKKYQGAMWFCIMASLGYAWYPIFFCARLIFISLIVSLLCSLCAVFATICFSRVSALSYCAMILYDVWLIYLLILNFQIFFMT